MRISASLAARGHKVILLVGQSGASRKEILEYYGVEDRANLEIVQLPIVRKRSVFGFSWNGIFHFFVLIKLIGICRREKVQVIYLSVMKLASFLLRWRRWIRADRFLYELHELGIYPEIADPDQRALRTDRLERRTLPGMDGVIVTTEIIAKTLRTRFARLPIAAVPLGTPAVPGNLPSYSFVRKERYDVCYVGQLYPAQGVDLLLRAAARVEQVTLHIVGGLPEEIARLQSLAGALGLSGRVLFHGFIPPKNVSDLIPRMDILALPARDTVRMNYVAHIKIYEYMSYGRPIVATSLRSTRETLEDGEDAVLVKPDDPAAFAEGLRRLIDHPELARKIAEKALERSPAYYWEARAQKIERFISDLSGGSERIA
jgi:glycosyltransferase involved in cell wall biosynthesis